MKREKHYCHSFSSDIHSQQNIILSKSVCHNQFSKMLKCLMFTFNNDIVHDIWSCSKIAPLLRKWWAMEWTLTGKFWRGFSKFWLFFNTVWRLFKEFWQIFKQVQFHMVLWWGEWGPYFENSDVFSANFLFLV